MPADELGLLPLQPERLRAMGYRSLGDALGAGRIAIVAPTLRQALIVRLGDGYPHRTGGYGGWEDVERPGRVPATRFAGSPTLTMDIPIVLGHWQQGWSRSIEDQIRVLEQMARQPAGARRGEHPPLLELHGPVPHGGATWVIDDIVWEGATVVAGHRVRARATLRLRRHVAVDLVEVRPAKKRGRGATRTVTVKQGERWPQFAARVLGARGSRQLARAWRKVRELNPRLRDTRQIKPGLKVQVPR